jgi:hypothetical protein
VEIKRLTLYFRPSYAFEFKERSTGKVRVLEVDAVTGQVRAGSVFKREMVEVFSESEVFKIGRDVALALVPGGEAAKVLVTRIVEKQKTKKDDEIRSKIHRAQAEEKPAKKETKSSEKAGRTRISLPDK